MQEMEKYIRLYGVVGYPLEHSLSPVLHNWGFEINNLPYVYMKWPVQSQNLGAFPVCMETLPIYGVSVTIPHKEKIIPFLDRITREARDIRAVNTLCWENGELWGENTDWYGFMQPLEKMRIEIDSALILGAGGAALGCIVGLQKLGVQKIYLAARKKQRLKELKKEFAIIPVEWDSKEKYSADLLVNCTPLGMSGGWEDICPYQDSLDKFYCVYDLVYNPLQTKLLQKASSSGCEILSGIYMFIYQAMQQFYIWTGKYFSVQKAETKLKQYHI